MKKNNDPGLGVNFQKQVNRFMNADGTYNIERKGGGRKRLNIYAWCVHSHWGILFLAMVSAYLFINLVFALAYMGVGIYQFKGVDKDLGSFLNCFFFSVQTFTTVGYGSISPHGLGAHTIAMFEAFLGFLSFSVATGILYGRFSKPSAHIRFSENIILAPYENGEAVMFKLVNLRSKILMKNSIQVILILENPDQENNKFNKEYHSLSLETNSINFFPLTWTIVHAINKDSPLSGMTVEEIKRRRAEIIVLFEGYDETFNQSIIRKHSYAGEQWLGNVKFQRNFVTDNNGKIILNLDGIDNYESI